MKAQQIGRHLLSRLSAPAGRGKRPLETPVEPGSGTPGAHQSGQGVRGRGFFIGIDPGKTGAAVAISRDLILVHDWKSPEAAREFFKLVLEQGRIEMAVIEDVDQKRMPHKGRFGAYGLGLSSGFWQMLCICFGVAYQLLPPGEWQKAVLMPGGGKDSKARSMATVRALYPGLREYIFLRSRHHHRADAALLAHYAVRTSGRK
ncbi:hypothetical protein [Desulfatitalea tepidiphila]|uniref:hypothetical protein n=1 Tax=Desulfatitalea tepidiphila TaxID=1185843 RepID=UPI0006B54D6E|nr:hypothetical protein [Desulfatitalea tepidiphila]